MGWVPSPAPQWGQGSECPGPRPQLSLARCCQCQAPPGLSIYAPPPAARCVEPACHASAAPWPPQTLDRDSGDPGLPPGGGDPLGRYSGCLRAPKKLDMHQLHAPGISIWELFKHVEVTAKKKKKRSRCRLCGEQWWGIRPSFILGHVGFNQDGRSRSMANVRRSTTRKTPFGGRSGARYSTRKRCA